MYKSFFIVLLIVFKLIDFGFMKIKIVSAETVYPVDPFIFSETKDWLVGNITIFKSLFSSIKELHFLNIDSMEDIIFSDSFFEIFFNLRFCPSKTLKTIKSFNFFYF
jgi:hypothetical protein